MEPARRRSESDYHFGRVLGEGSFSTVYVARELESRKEYASKSKSKFRSYSMTSCCRDLPHTHAAHYEWIENECVECVWGTRK